MNFVTANFGGLATSFNPKTDWGGIASGALGAFASIFGKKSSPPVVQPPDFNS